MPVTSAQVSGLIQAQLAAQSCTGQDVGKIALGLGIGVQNWVAAIIIQSQDVGTAGAGTGTPLPVTAPALVGNVIAQMQAVFTGTDCVKFATGIGNGIQLALLQGLTQTTHAGVGVGTGIARFISNGSVPFLQAGLSGAQVTGQYAAQLATGVGNGLDITLQALILTLPIVGSASPSGASGVGIGKIV